MVFLDSLRLRWRASTPQLIWPCSKATPTTGIFFFISLTGPYSPASGIPASAGFSLGPASSTRTPTSYSDSYRVPSFNHNHRPRWLTRTTRRLFWSRSEPRDKSHQPDNSSRWWDTSRDPTWTQKGQEYWRRQASKEGKERKEEEGEGRDGEASTKGSGYVVPGLYVSYSCEPFLWCSLGHQDTIYMKQTNCTGI